MEKLLLWVYRIIIALFMLYIVITAYQWATVTNTVINKIADNAREQTTLFKEIKDVLVKIEKNTSEPIIVEVIIDNWKLWQEK